MATRKLLSQGSEPHIYEEVEVSDSLDNWFPSERVLSKNRVIPSNCCVVIAGPLETNEFILTTEIGGIIVTI